MEQEHQGLMGSITKVGAGWDRPQRHCCLGGATSPLYQLLKIEFGSFFCKINKLFYEQISEGKKIVLPTFSTDSDTAEVT